MPCGCWRGRREHVRPRARRPSEGLGERGNPHTGAPARRHGEVGASPMCCRAGSRRTTPSSPRATGRGGTGTRPMLAAAGHTSDRHGRRSRALQATRAKRSVRMAAVLVPVLGFDKHCAARLPTCRCAPSPPQGRQPPSPRGAPCPASRRGCAPAGMPGGRDPASPVPCRP